MIRPAAQPVSALLEELRTAQRARFAGLDELLPVSAPEPGTGEGLAAALPSGAQVAGLLVRTESEPGTLPSLWSARHVQELYPLVGAAAGPGIAALLRAWRQSLDAEPPGPDSACVLTWPSRDGEAGRQLLDHGFLPLSVLAVRRGTPAPQPAPLPGVTVRRARPGDLDVACQLALAELAYSVNFGSTVLRADATELKRAALDYRLRQGDPVWLLERDGVAVGLAECWLTESEPGLGHRFPVPPGRWGYVNTVSVLPGARGGGAGQRLMAAAHADLLAAGAIGTYLYYNPPNPLSSVFWPRQGYRPLWTVWEIRPAVALRQGSPMSSLMPRSSDSA